MLGPVGLWIVVAAALASASTAAAARVESFSSAANLNMPLFEESYSVALLSSSAAARASIP